jgi:hypothetical protein
VKLSLAVAGVAAVLTVACGNPSGRGTPVVSPPAAALIQWQGFPADQHPRPIVWIGNSSPNGFSTDGGKIAAMCSKFALASALPKRLPSQATATWADGTKVTYLGISAAKALAAMSRPVPGMAPSDCGSVNPLVINSARLGTFDFDTDRGKSTMTAWLFSAMGADGEFAYPALAPAAFWNGGLVASSSGTGASLGADGRSLTYRFWGVPESAGPCGAAYRGVLAESTTAVAIAIQMIPNAKADSPVACDAMAQERSINVPLASPLGGRVVVDAAGDVVALCPGTLSRGC